MTPAQARRLYALMTPDEKARLGDLVTRLPELIAKCDRMLTDMGQRMADDAEAYANSGH